MPVVIRMEGAKVAVADKPDGSKLLILIDGQSGVQVQADFPEESAKEIGGRLAGSGIVVPTPKVPPQG